LTIHATRAVLDGEIVALDANGRPSFQALQHRTSAGSFALVITASTSWSATART
jgi:bifunctional non-homologous end joining protein LigD